MTNIENEYRGLMAGILHGGLDKADTSKKISFNAARTELLWILQGRTDLKYLEDNGVKYWRPDYERSGRTDETLGPVYGAQWRNFNGTDQLKQLVYSISTNPNSRRLMVSAWNPGQMPFMVLPPCHYAFQVYINNGVMDLMWQQRSADVFLGLPYDITMYGLLLEMLAKGANLKPGKLIGQLGDCHLYNNHLEQAKVYLDRPKRVLPKLDLKEGIWFDTVIEKIHIPTADKIKLLKYNPLPTIKAELSVGN